MSLDAVDCKDISSHDFTVSFSHTTVKLSIKRKKMSLNE